MARPATRLPADLDDNEREALLGLAEMVRNGDVEGIKLVADHRRERQRQVRCRADRRPPGSSRPGPDQHRLRTRRPPPRVGRRDRTRRRKPSSSVTRPVPPKPDSRRCWSRCRNRCETPGYDQAGPQARRSSASAARRDMGQAIEIFRNDVPLAPRWQCDRTAAAAGQVPPPAPLTAASRPPSRPRT